MIVTRNKHMHIPHSKQFLLSIILFTCLGWTAIYAQETPTPEPRYGTIELSPGFASPYTLDATIESGDFNLFELQGSFATRTACAGLTSTEPLVILNWNTTTNNSTLFFRFEGTGGDPTMYLQVYDSTTDTRTEWCNDDYEAKQSPMFGFTGLPGNTQIAIWIGTYYPGETITGTLSIAESRASVTASPTSTAAPQYGPIRSQITKLGGLLIEEYCRAEFDGMPDARHYNYASLTWGCYPQAPDSEGVEIELSEVCRWQYGEGAYAVQDGDNFRTYACYYHGAYDPNTLVPDRPTRAETIVDYEAALEALQAISTNDLEAEYCVAPLYVLPADLDSIGAASETTEQIRLQTLQPITHSNATDAYLVFDPAALAYSSLSLAGKASSDATITERQHSGVVFADLWNLTTGQDAIWNQEGNFWQVQLDQTTIGTEKFQNLTSIIQENVSNCRGISAINGSWRCTGIDMVYHCSETPPSAD